MNQNYTYGGQQSSQQSSSQQQQQQSYNTYTSFHPTSSSYTVSSVQPSNSSGTTYIPNYVAAQGTEVRIVNAHGEPVEHRYIINQQPGSDDKLAALIDSYFVDHPQPSHNQSHQNQQSWSGGHGQHSGQGAQVQYVTQGPGGTTVKTMVTKMSALPELTEKERAKKERQAEAARLRYHALSADKKKELNARRTEAQRRKRQREKEMEQLEDILRQTNDIQEDPDITEQLREKRRRARWAEAARLRYQRMTPEQKAECNERRKRREQEKAYAQCKGTNMLTGDPSKDDSIVTEHIKSQNKKKAEAARLRYHAMSNEQKRSYNQKRTEAFRRKRMEEEMLLTMPIGRVSGEVFDRAQQIVERNRKRAEAARLRYQRMTPDQRKVSAKRAADAARLRYQRMSADQRKVYNQKRYTPKKARSEDSKGTPQPEFVQDDYDALSSIEREVMKRTQQAQQTIRRKQIEEAQLQRLMPNGDQEPGPSAGTYVVTQPGNQIHQVQIPGQQQMITVTKMIQQPQTVAQLKQGSGQLPQVQHVINPQSGPYQGNIVVITTPGGAQQTIYQTRGDPKFQ